MKFKELYEARKNPEMNPKISAYDALKKYENDPNIFIHFSKVNKLGINPKTESYMPKGIFAYPYKEFVNYKKVKNTLKDTEDFRELSSLAQELYFTKLEYIFILKAKTAPVDMNKYSKADLSKDLKKLLKMFPDYTEKIKKHLANINDDLYFKYNVNNKKHPGSQFWYLVKYICEVKNFSLNGLLRNLGYHGLMDNGYGIFASKEKFQTVFLSKADVSVVKVILNKSYKKTQKIEIIDYSRMKK